jgi:hypothetical protein
VTCGDACSLQHAGNWFYRLFDGGPGEHLPRDRAATDVAEKVKVDKPEQVCSATA